MNKILYAKIIGFALLGAFAYAAWPDMGEETQNNAGDERVPEIPSTKAEEKSILQTIADNEGEGTGKANEKPAEEPNFDVFGLDKKDEPKKPVTKAQSPDTIPAKKPRKARKRARAKKTSPPKANPTKKADSVPSVDKDLLFFDPKAATGPVAAQTQSTATAVVHSDVEVNNGKRVVLRVVEGTGDLRANQFLYATASLSAYRVGLSLNSTIAGREATVIDQADGLQGIYSPELVQNTESRNAKNIIIDEGADETGRVGGIVGGFLKRRTNSQTVWLRKNHRVIIKY